MYAHKYDTGNGYIQKLKHLLINRLKVQNKNAINIHNVHYLQKEYGMLPLA